MSAVPAAALYLQHFGLRCPPFQLTPNTDFFYAGAERGALLDALLYALLHSEGIVLVTGEVGTGKTMLSRMLLERAPGALHTLFVAAPNVQPEELLLLLAEELGVSTDERRPLWLRRALQHRLIALHAEGRRVVLVIDEAHAMQAATLEEIRLLSNLETAQHKLLQILLLGQDELHAVLAAPELRSFRERIVHRFAMPRLDTAEVATYLQFRLQRAAVSETDCSSVFAPDAIAVIAAASEGLTRRVNILADKCLLAAYADGVRQVSAGHARQAVIDAGFRPLSVARAGQLQRLWQVLRHAWLQRLAPLRLARPAAR